MSSLLYSKLRLFNLYKSVECEKEHHYRTSFHKDYDRVIFSNSFRRLSKKTQVHPLAKNDHVHNRLTHSLEVASVGRSLGLDAGHMLVSQGIDVNPEDIAYIVQTACLAHDIGNPPFGHAGEEVIKDWFKNNQNSEYINGLTSEQKSDFINLDGNAQSFRVVTQLENDRFNGGLHLTIATLATLIKYPNDSHNLPNPKKQKFNFFQSEGKIFRTIFTSMELLKTDGTYKRHPLSYLMEVADDICYGLLDIQDAIELNLVTLEDICTLTSEILDPKDIENIKKDTTLTTIQKTSKIVAKSIHLLALEAMKQFKINYTLILSDEQPQCLVDLFSDNYKTVIEKTKILGREKIYNDKRKIQLELGAYNIIETLLKNLVIATYHFWKDKDSLSFKDKRALELMGDDKPQHSENLYFMYQQVIDFIIGMTDNHAKYIASQLNGY